ncbi:MAG: hypothetical protein NUW37_11630 [Planctomycetes bacterium]|nr:hypothetical protein [Planctomycetota bacterium]
MIDASIEVKNFIRSLLKEHPEIKQPEIFKRLKAKFGHAVAPVVIKHIRDDLGQVSPTAEKHGVKPSASKRGRPVGSKNAASGRSAPVHANTGVKILEAALPGEKTPPKKRGRGRRADDKRKITMENLYDYLVVLIDGEQVIPFQTSSKAMARERIEELLQKGFREENIAFYERAKYGIKASVSVKF